jgi:hypothetical protein
MIHRPGVIALFAIALTACAGTRSSPPSESSMSSTSASTDSLPESRFEGPFDTQLHVVLDLPPDQLVADLRYVLRNNGREPLMVFDRGTAHDVGIERQVLGEVGEPRQEASGEDLTLMHVAIPLPEPSPTSPPTPLALELAPGAVLAGRFKVMLQGPALPKRLRWCLGMAPKEESMLFSPMKTKDGQLWTASFAVTERQQRACSPWYDVQNRRFDE